MPEKIISILNLDGRRSRSVALDRDLTDPTALDGYLITPNSLGALRQIGNGIASARTQRAWKIVGPYGSGKSALGVLLAQVVGGAQRYPDAAKSLSLASTQVADLFGGTNRLALAVVGSRVSFGLAMAKTICASLDEFGKNKRAQKLRKQIDLAAGIYNNRPLNAAAGELCAEFASVVVASGYDGVLLMIDEVGKFVEHAALFPEHGDLIALQQIAEYACTNGDDKLVVVAMLHQHFASYAAGVGRALSDEWHKVAARFEEVPFDEPVERYAHFASNALASTTSRAPVEGIIAASKMEYSNAFESGLLRTPTELDKKLFKHPERLYPLHPVTLAALATISKRYGQSERSFHAFLTSSEPRGLRDFAEQTEIAGSAWYRVQDLYDYLSNGNELRFRELDIERRWVFAQTLIEQNSADPVTALVLKAMAILELVKSSLKVLVNAETICWAIGAPNVATVDSVLHKLADEGTLVHRRKHSEYAIAVSNAVNVEALFESAARGDENELIVSGITTALAQKLVVANRHYDETGTIRTLGTLVGTAHLWPTIPELKSEEVRPDGWIKLVLVTKDSDEQKQVEQRLAQEKQELNVQACLALSGEARAALAEYAIWNTVVREVNSKTLDPWSSRYVEARLQDASETVERLVTSSLIPTEHGNGPVFWHMGEPIKNSERMNPSQVGSWLFDKVYHRAPRIINELINKDRPTSAIVLARQRLFELLVNGDTSKRISGDKEYPPERLVHSTLLKETGMWMEKDGHWTLQAPTATAPSDISAVWHAISEQLASKEPKTFGDVVEALSAPPFGVRGGPAGIWVATYLMIHRSRCAIFERGSLVLELTAEHLQRMYKNPQTFKLRELAAEEGGVRLLNDYRDVLSAIGCEVSAAPTYLEMTRTLFRWFAKLPEFTARTTRVGKDAALVRSVLSKSTDPIALLTQTLQRTYRESKSNLIFKDWLTDALTDLGMAHRKLQDEVAAELSKGFGIPGPLSRVRAQLQIECTREAARLADVNLKSFILRCTDLVLTDEKWLDSVGSLIAHKPLDSWEDDTLSEFQEQLTGLCGRYKRWIQVAIRRGIAPRAAERFVGMTLTMPGGEESSIFVTRNEISDEIATNVLALITQAANGNHDVAAAALAQAMLTLQSQQATTNEHDREENHG
jgi:hypothetical protein